jgi:hypothetical protein
MSELQIGSFWLLQQLQIEPQNTQTSISGDSVPGKSSLLAFIQ